uniref:Uncharacterized protein n=2 Tax=Rhodosorus marinus TaxID=101924 RepID=A0A7S0BEJ4_9RHOD|mmetsp:Transcript_11298/g.16372  ORF Transcript_11298/g.16372 Transcript_11298/m.16372 type:complete len:301 (+) Transcript_11298:991-1893(+)
MPKKRALGTDAELLALLSNASSPEAPKSSTKPLKTKDKEPIEASAQLEEAEDDYDEEDLFDDEEEEVKTLEDYDEDDRDEIDQYIGEMATQRGVTAKVLDVNEDEYITVTEGPDKDFIWGDDLAEEDKVAFDAGLDEAPRIGIFGGTAKEAARRGEIVEGSSDWFARQLFETSLSVQETNSLAWLKWVKGVGAPPPEMEQVMATRFPKPKLGTIIGTPTPMVSLSGDEDEADDDEDEDEVDIESNDSEILNAEETDDDAEDVDDIGEGDDIADLDDLVDVVQDLGLNVDLEEISVADENS